MRLEVSFANFPIVSTFNDAQDYDLEVDNSFLDAVKDIVHEGNGRAVASGISWVKPFENGHANGGYYILTAKKKNKTYSMLFQLGENEKSRLVGVYPEEATREELLNVLYEVLSERVEEINLVI